MASLGKSQEWQGIIQPAYMSNGDLLKRANILFVIGQTALYLCCLNKKAVA
jgi:hypothetical protein